MSSLNLETCWLTWQIGPSAAARLKSSTSTRLSGRCHGEAPPPRDDEAIVPGEMARRQRWSVLSDGPCAGRRAALPRRRSGTGGAPACSPALSRRSTRQTCQRFGAPRPRDRSRPGLAPARNDRAASRVPAAGGSVDVCSSLCSVRLRVSAELRRVSASITAAGRTPFFDPPAVRAGGCRAGTVGAAADRSLAAR